MVVALAYLILPHGRAEPRQINLVQIYVYRRAVILLYFSSTTTMLSHETAEPKGESAPWPGLYCLSPASISTAAQAQ